MKRAIVVSGGGSKGAYAVGVLDQFKKDKPHLKFNVFVGTSTGALMAPFLALDKFNDLVHIYQNTKTKEVLKEKDNKAVLKQSSLYSTTPLKKIIDKYLSDAECEKLLRSRTKDIHILTVCLQTKKLTVFSNRQLPISKSGIYDCIKMKSAQHLKRAMLASANQPIFMPPIKVNKDILSGDKAQRQYIDGGLAEYAGIEMAMDAQADEIFTIFLSSKEDQVSTKTYSKIFDMLGPTVGILTGNVGFHDLRIPRIQNTHLQYLKLTKDRLLSSGVSQSKIEEAFNFTLPQQEFELRKAPHVIHLIRPSEVLKAGTNGLEFKPREMRKMFALGQKDGKEFMVGLKIT